MSGRDRDRFRKYESGAGKAKKCKLREEFDKTQKGALDNYFPNEAVKQEEDFDLVLDSSVACAAKTENDKSDKDGNEPLTALLSAANSLNHEIRGSESGYFENISAENNLCPETTKDICDPGSWEHVTCTIRDLLVEKVPIRLPDDHKYPINEEKMHFSRKFYMWKIPNKECVDRRWLVYSQLKDAALCFCCKLYGKSSAEQLANEGCNDWKHLGGKLEKHKFTPEHINTFTAKFDHGRFNNSFLRLPVSTLVNLISQSHSFSLGGKLVQQLQYI
jgi:hypothetical protein